MDDRELAQQLTEIVLAIDGVTEIFPATPALVGAAAQLAQAVARRGEESRDRIVFSRVGEGCELRIRIGVDAAASTVTVAREVSDAVEAALAEAIGGPVVVHVEVGSIT